METSTKFTYEIGPLYAYNLQWISLSLKHIGTISNDEDEIQRMIVENYLREEE